MKGMIRNNWYLSSKGALVAQWGVAGALYGIALLSPSLGDGLPFISLFLIATVVLSILPVLTTIHEETRSQWLQNLVVAPIKRKTILQGKYLCLLLCIAFTAMIVFAMCLVYPVLVPAVADIFTPPTMIQALMQSINVALLTSAFHFMVSYSFGFAKSDVLILVSVLVAVVFQQIFMTVIANFTQQFVVEAAILLGIASVILIISYFVAKRFLYKREL